MSAIIFVPILHLSELAFSAFLLLLYKRGSSRYPGKLLKCKNDTNLHFFLLSFLLAYTLILWITNFFAHRTQIALIWRSAYNELVPEGSSFFVKWGWATYFFLVLFLNPLIYWHEAMKRIKRQTPIVKCRTIFKPITYIREQRRQWRERGIVKAERARLAYPQEHEIDIEKSYPEDETTALLISEEPIESLASILLFNAKTRRRLAHVTLYFQWMCLLITSYYLINRSRFHDHLNNFMRVFLDVFALVSMVYFPMGWIGTLITTIEAAVDQGEAERSGGEMQIWKLL